MLTQLPEPIPEDIWDHILPNLRCPIPPPLSYPTRSELRQPYLAAMMRVCKRFKKICQPLLYNRVITDDLPLLIRANANSKDKRGKRNLDLVETLLIGYSDKEAQPDPTYQQLLAGGHASWEYCGVTPGEREDALLRSCQREAEGLGNCVGLLNKRGMAEILPKLESVAVSSRYGSQAGTWGRYEDLCKSRGKPPMAIMMMPMYFQQFLSKSKNLRRFCLRDPAGPLSLSGCTQPYGNPFHTTVHFGSNVGNLPIVLGSPTQWSYEGDDTEEWSRIITLLGQRILYITNSPMYSPSTTLDLHISCSTSTYGPPSFDTKDLLFRDVDWALPPGSLIPIFHPKTYESTRELSPYLQEAISDKLQNKLRAWIDKSTLPRTGSSATWGSSPDCPACDACGWSGGGQAGIGR